MNWSPIGNAAETGLSVAEFIAKVSVTRIGMIAAMWIVESHVQEERPNFIKRELIRRRKVGLSSLFKLGKKERPLQH